MEHKWPALETDSNLSTPLSELVTEKLPWLFREFGFRVVSSGFEPAHFGDSHVILQSDTLRLRFTRDRGQVLIDVGVTSEPEHWWGLIALCEVIRNASIQPRYKLDALASVLQENFSALAEALGPKLPETRQELERRAAERLRALRAQMQFLQQKT